MKPKFVAFVPIVNKTETDGPQTSSGIREYSDGYPGPEVINAVKARAAMLKEMADSLDLNVTSGDKIQIRQRAKLYFGSYTVKETIDIDWETAEDIDWSSLETRS